VLFNRGRGSCGGIFSTHRCEGVLDPPRLAVTPVDEVCRRTSHVDRGATRDAVHALGGQPGARARLSPSQSRPAGPAALSSGEILWDSRASATGMVASASSAQPQAGSPAPRQLDALSVGTCAVQPVVAFRSRSSWRITAGTCGRWRATPAVVCAHHRVCPSGSPFIHRLYPCLVIRRHHCFGSLAPREYHAPPASARIVSAPSARARSSVFLFRCRQLSVPGRALARPRLPSGFLPLLALELGTDQHQ